MSYNYALLLAMSLSANIVLTMTTIEQVHLNIFQNHTVDCYKETVDRDKKSLDVPMLSAKFFYFTPRADEQMPQEPLSLFTLNCSDLKANQYPISLPVVRVLARALDIQPAGRTVTTFNELLGFETSTYIFRATLRCRSTSIDINYDPFARNIQAITIFSPKMWPGHGPLFTSIIEKKSDRFSSVDQPYLDRIKVMSNFSLVEFASLLLHNDKAD